MSRKDAKNAKKKNWHGPVLNIILHAHCNKWSE
jgi:hypothetical protein